MTNAIFLKFGVRFFFESAICVCIEVKSLSFIPLNSKTLFVAGAVKEVSVNVQFFGILTLEKHRMRNMN